VKASSGLSSGRRTTKSHSEAAQDPRPKPNAHEAMSGSTGLLLVSGGDTEIPKGKAMEQYHLERKDFIGLKFREKPVTGKTYKTHLYEIKEVWRRAVQLGRIPKDTPQPRPVLYAQHITVAEALVRLPGCAGIQRRLAPWIWRAIVRHYEHVDTGFFTDAVTREEIAYQLRIAVPQLNAKYQRWPRTTIPLPASQSAKTLREVLSKAPRCTSDAENVPEGIQVNEDPCSGDTSTEWVRDYKVQVNDAVERVVQEHGKAYQMTARWLVYDTLAECIGSLFWYRGHKVESRWEDDALDALEGPFKIQ